MSTVARGKDPSTRYHPLTRRIFSKQNEKKDAGNQGHENHSKVLRLGETAGKNLGRLKSDIKKTAVDRAKMLYLREQNKLEITATFGSNYTEFIWSRILVIAYSL